MASGDVLHDVALDDLVLEDGDAVVDQNGRRGGLKVGPEDNDVKLTRGKNSTAISVSPPN